MKTVEELAREYVENVLKNSDHKDAVERMREVIEMVYEQAATETLTSLLEELPEVNDPGYRNNFTDGERMYMIQIKSLIQNKLK